MRSLTTGLLLPAFPAFALALALASGCSSKTDDASATAASSGDSPKPIVPLVAASGSRLKARFLAGGGAHAFVGFHDSMRDEDCTFQEAETGRMRCLPAMASATPSNLFSDAACQVGVATKKPCDADVKFGVALRAVGGGCGQVERALRKVLPASARLYVPGQSGCAEQLGGAPVSQSGPVVALGDVVPWTDFADATETTMPGDAISERVLVASDGARQHVGFHDPKLDADCTFQLVADGTTRCVPQASMGPVIYGDSECQSAFLVESYPTTGGPCTTGAATATAKNLWLEPSPTTCGGLRNVYSLHDYTGPSSSTGSTELYRYSIDGSGSGSGSGPSTASCNAAGTIDQISGGSRKAIDKTLTASLPKVPRVGSGARLVPALVWPAGAATTLVPGFHDTERDVDCTFALASDGKMRCLPVASGATLYFTDDACKSSSLVAIPSAASCIDAKHFATVPSTTCPPAVTVYALGATASSPPSSVVTTPGHCAKATGGAAVKGAVDATVVDPTQFVEGAPSVE